MRVVAIMAIVLGVLVGGYLVGPTPTTGQDQTDERLSAFETQVAEQKADLSQLRKRVRTLEGREDDQSEPDGEEAPTGSQQLGDWQIDLVRFETAESVAPTLSQIR